MPSKTAEAASLIVNTSTPVKSPATVIAPVPASNNKSLFAPVISPFTSITPTPAPVSIELSCDNVIPLALVPNNTWSLVVIILPPRVIEAAPLACVTAVIPASNVKLSSVPLPSVKVPVLANVAKLVMVASSNIETLYVRPAVTVSVAAVKLPPAALPNVTSPPAAASVIVKVVTFTMPSKTAEAASLIVNTLTPAKSLSDVIAPVPASNNKELFPPVIAPSRSIAPAAASVSIVEAAVNVIPALAEPNLTLVLVVKISPATLIAAAPPVWAIAVIPETNVKSSDAALPSTTVPVLENVVKVPPVMSASAFISTSYAALPAEIVRTGVVKLPSNITVSPAASISVMTTAARVVTVLSKVTPPASVIVNVSIRLTTALNSVLAWPESTVRFSTPLPPVTAANVITSASWLPVESKTVVPVPTLKVPV